MDGTVLVAVRFDACGRETPFVPLAACYGAIVVACVASRALESVVVGELRRVRRLTSFEPFESVVLSPLSVSMEIPLVRFVIVLVCLFADAWAIACFAQPHLWALTCLVSTAFMSVAITVFYSWQHYIQSGILAAVTLPVSLALNAQLVRYSPGTGDAWIALTVVELVLTFGGFVPYPLVLTRAPKELQRYLPVAMSLVEYGLTACQIAGLVLVRNANAPSLP